VVWWSRLAAPTLPAWTPDRPLRLVEQTVATHDPDPKALACYALLIQTCDERCTDEVWLRFVTGRPVSAVTTAFLTWCAEPAAAQGKRFLVMVWENASWQVSRAVHAWLKHHPRQVVLTGRGCRIIPSFLPVKSPWLNPIDPKWLHAKRRIVEPDRLLSAAELRRRVVASFDCTHEPDLIQPKKPTRSKKVA
jgi:DDE superfamily endonuclease